MKNKGFTLIELLAIIVILAIIAVITVPIMLNIIENSKRGAAADSAYVYKEAVNKWYLQELSHDSNYKLNGTYKVRNGKFDGQDLSLSGDRPSRGLLTYENNVIASGCLQYDEYTVVFENGQVVDSNESECDPLVYDDADNSGSLTRYDILSFGDEQFYVLEPENSSGNIVLLAKTCLRDNDGVWRQNSYCRSMQFVSVSGYWHTNGVLKDEYKRDLNGNSASFSGNPYPYVYYVEGNDNNNVDDVVDSYVESLSDKATGRLLSYEEAVGLSDSVRNVSAFYWLGSATSGSLWHVHNNNITSNSPVNYSYIRPVIEIPVSEL